MVLASAVGIFAIPPLYVAFQALREKLKGHGRESTDVPGGGLLQGAAPNTTVSRPVAWVRRAATGLVAFGRRERRAREPGAETGVVVPNNPTMPDRRS
jgi:hypothetical protein